MAKVKADLHNHLRTSSRSYDADFNRAVDIATKRLGVGAIFGVVNFADKRYEHFTGLRGYERVYVGEKNNGVYVPQQNVLVIKGQEVSTNEGHILVIGLGKDVHLKQYKTLQDTLKEARDNNTVISVNADDKGIRNTNSQTAKRKKNAVFGAIHHLVALAFIVKVARKGGLGKLFETDRPN